MSDDDLLKAAAAWLEPGRSMDSPYGKSLLRLAVEVIARLRAELEAVSKSAAEASRKDDK